MSEKVTSKEMEVYLKQNGWNETTEGEWFNSDIDTDAWGRAILYDLETAYEVERNYDAY